MGSAEVGDGTLATRDHVWAPDHPVLEVMRQRRAAGCSPAERRAAHDPVRLGLAVEGGGMRGVSSAAMLSALEDTGMAGVFDGVYSLSSGAINSAYFMVGGCWRHLSIYYDDLTSKRFIDFSRPLRGKAIMDLDYAYGEVVDVRKPLDYAKVLAADPPLTLGLTLVDTIETAVVRGFDDAADLREALVATSWLPGAVQGTATFRGARAVDGGVLVAHPYRLAVADACTHVLSLSTHPILEARRYNPVALRGAVRYLDRLQPGLGGGYLRSLDECRQDLDRFLSSMTAPEPSPYVLDIGPLRDAPQVKRHETDPGRLIQAARHAYEVMYCAVERHAVSEFGASSLRAVPRMAMVPHRSTGTGS